MQFTLKCRDGSGSVAFPSESIDGTPVPERRYQINDHLVILSGLDYIVHHDASELLKMPDSLFRMLTMQEQDALSLAAQQAAMAQESTPVVEDVPPALSDLSDNKKKASGG